MYRQDIRTVSTDVMKEKSDQTISMTVKLLTKFDRRMNNFYHANFDIKFRKRFITWKCAPHYEGYDT